MSVSRLVRVTHRVLQWVVQLEPNDLVQRRYRVGRPLGQGGVGTAYLVHDLVWDRAVCLKLLNASSADAGVLRAEFGRLHGLVHPHVCRVHDFGVHHSVDGQHPYYTADYIVGSSIDLYARGKSFDEIRLTIAGVLDGLSFLHGLGIRHGDLTPSNVLVDERGRPVLIDLSCSERLNAAPSGLISGTPGFIAPEVMRGASADVRADLYAFGKTLERVASGLREPPSSAVRTCIERLTASAHEQRPTTARAVLDMLGLPWTFEDRAQSIPPKLIGREDAQRRFDRFLADLLEGKPSPRIFTIAGPNGMGRSRLLQELKWRAQRKCTVVEGRASQQGGIFSMLERACDGNVALERNVSGIIEALDRLATSPTPRLLVLDDMHTLERDSNEALHALLRSMGPMDPWAILLASDRPSNVNEEQLVFTLVPLGSREIAEWIAGDPSDARTTKIMELTGGYPSEIVALLSAMSPTDAVSLGALDRLDAVVWDARRQQELGAFSEAARTLLGRLAVSELAQDAHANASPDDNVEIVADLVNRGWIRPELGRLRLARAGEAARIVRALGESTEVKLHEEAANRLKEALRGDPTHDAWVRARIVYHSSKARDWNTAERELVEHAADALIAPQLWLAAVESLQQHTHDAEVLLSIAGVQRAAGQAKDALRTLARVRRARRRDLLPRLHRTAGEVYLGAGNPKRALRHLERAYALENSEETRAEIADHTSRTWMKLGNFRAAIECARNAFSSDLAERARADLHHDIGVASSYLGDTTTARRELRTAIELHGSREDHRNVVRAQSALALVEYRSGATDAAAESYRLALERAEQHGLSDYVVSMSASYAAVCHQLGDWGLATKLYAHAHRLARVIGRKSTEATLSLNTAKLHADVGDARAARDALARASRVSTELGLEFLETGVRAIDGEVCMVEGNLERAVSCFEEARSGFATEGATREVVETELNLVGAHLARGDVEAGFDALLRAEAVAASLEAHDLVSRLLLARGRLEIRGHEKARALRRFEEALQLSRNVKQRALEAEIEAELAMVAEEEGSDFLASRYRNRALEHWERIAMSLAVEQRDAFWSHRLRRTLKVRQRAVRVEQPTSQNGIERKLLRLLEINKRLNSSRDVHDVLEWTMDAAIELTAAERGFLILAKGEGADRSLDAPVARNMDREGIGKSNLKFSRSIAEKVIESGEPIVTTDAEADERFAEARSIHAMQLKSVCVVPIVSPTGTMGAIYLDHRFQVGGFQEADVQLLLAFADQVAIALQNAHLVDSLKERTVELERERERVELLMRGQAQELERLSEELDAKQRVLELRYDYSSIVGQSAAMRSVLEKLDRVIDKPVTVLIEGESGTGKELIARAIHFNSDRRERPFVAVNCGALPENLLEAELFGYVKGAFTGANRDRLGLFLEANGGTLFLDELGEMPVGMQVRLLRALQEREVQPLGASVRRKFDVRIVCATNRHLKKEVNEGRFREDLYYRVAVMDISLPPLRDRREDVPVLADAILRRFSSGGSQDPPRVTQDAMRALVTYAWPGNVRELENVLTRAFVLAEGGVIRRNDLSLPVVTAAPPPNVASETEADSIRAALEATRWNVRSAAARLGVSRATLHRKLKHHGIQRAAR